MANRFSIADYDCVGFDMDHTICKYNLRNLFEMEYRVLTDYLIGSRGYDDEFKMPFRINSTDNFLTKGLVLDIERGNLLKLAADGSVLCASHGTRMLDAGDIEAAYGPLHINDLLRQFAADLVQATEGALSKCIRPFKDYFDMPAALICARIVDLQDRRNGKSLDKYVFWRDVILGLVDMFKRDNLKTNSGGYYPQMKAQPGRYLVPCSDALKKWLADIHRRQVTFLVSGSDPGYVDHVATYSLGRDWTSYFDFIVCGAKKPGFFSCTRPFYKTAPEDGQPLDLNVTLRANTIYTQGNWQQLKSSMAYYCGMDKPKCIYFGDHLIQDVLAARRYASIDCAAVVEEMAAEGMINRADRHPDAGDLHSDAWGSLFYHPDGSDVTASGVSRINTLWGSIIRDNCKICIPSLEALASFPVSYRFNCAPLVVASFAGFVPANPCSLESK